MYGEGIQYTYHGLTVLQWNVQDIEEGRELCWGKTCSYSRGDTVKCEA